MELRHSVRWPTPVDLEEYVQALAERISWLDDVTPVEPTLEATLVERLIADTLGAGAVGEGPSASVRQLLTLGLVADETEDAAHDMLGYVGRIRLAIREFAGGNGDGYVARLGGAR